MKNIEKKKMNYYLELVNNFLEKLKSHGIFLEVRYDSTIENKDFGNSMSISYIFKNGSLKYWYLGIWGCGKWSGTYDCDSEDYISIFLIHKWHLDKFRPSSADISFDVKIKNPEQIDIQMDEIVTEIVNIKKHHILEYHSIFGDKYHQHQGIEDSHEMPCIEYFKDWFSNEVTVPVIENLSKKWSVKFLYWTLKVISIIDPRVDRGILFKEENCFSPWYTSGFLAKEWASDKDWAFNSFAWLYSKLPTKLCRLSGHRLFDAYWNISDFPGEITEKLENRMKRGVILD